MGIWNYIVGAFIIVFSIALIIVVLLQEGRGGGLSGVISGGGDSFLNKNKSRSIDAFFARWTKFVAIGFFLLVVAVNVLAFFFS